MRIKKWGVYILVLWMIFVPFYLIRNHWLKRSVRTIAVVAGLNRSRNGYSPEIMYWAGNDRIFSQGHSNIGYNVGDTLYVRYDPMNEYDFKVDDFSGCWLDIIMWLAPVVLFVTILFLPRDVDINIIIADGRIRIKRKY